MNFKKFGKYTIIKKLASGGMADILLATELSPTGFGRFIVIKRALSKFSDNEEFKDMFKNEGKIACNLKHKNITTIHEFGIEKNQFFLAMEYLSGKNLRELTKKLQARNIQLSIPNIIHIIKEISSGLNYAHNAIDVNTGQPLNIIHRDVSPQNVVLTFDGQVKLIDFGIAKIADTNLTRAGHLKGKFSYMSPEQATGNELDGRTDIFCLGIIFWELLTNKRLFASNNELVSLKKVRNCAIPDARKMNPDISSVLNNILNKNLSKNKNSRYTTAAKLEQDLNLFLNKNYPKYSHYDFITLMKQTYRKEIMSERENLKTYSIEFKKYTNSLNLEKSFKTPFILDMPDITSINQAGSKQTQSAFTESLLAGTKTENTNQLSNPANFFKTTQDEKNQTEKITIDKSTTLIQQNNLELEQEESSQTRKKLSNDSQKTQHTQLMNQAKISKIKTNPNLKLENIQNTKQQTRQSKLTTSFMSQYSSNWKDEDITFSKFKKISFLGFALLVIGSFAIGGSWLYKNQNKSVKTDPTFTDSSIPITTPLTSIPKNSKTNIKPAVQRAPTYADQNKKIWIASNPSNASIYINNKPMSKYTPSLLNIKLNSTVLITVKKRGFLPKHIQINAQNFKSKIFVKLVKDDKASEKTTLIHQ